MKKLTLLSLTLLISGCFEKNLTVYDYLTNKEKMESDLAKCISGELRDNAQCDIVKSAKQSYPFFIKNMYSEEDLRRFGKK